jgi:hypothetical protein
MSSKLQEKDYRRSKYNMKTVIFVTVLLAFVLYRSTKPGASAFVGLKKFHFREPSVSVTMPLQSQNNHLTGSDVDCGSPPSRPQFRTDFGAGPGTLVRGWPSKGGLYALQACDGVELDFLHLDRFKVTPRSQDAAEEDAHVANMRKLGASWWESEEEFIQDAIGYPRADTQILFTGWPSQGGAWVLKTTWLDAADRGVGRIRNAFNMEERCRSIEQLGGTFYPDPKDCPDLDLSA